MKIWIDKKNIIIAEHVRVANTFITRLIGWLNKRTIMDDEALIIEPCSSVHTFGMKETIDILFLDSSNRVVHIINGMKPYRISVICKEAVKAIEFKYGIIHKFDINVGDKIIIECTLGK